MTIFSSDYSSSSGGSTLKIQSITSDSLTNDWNYCILADATTGNITVTLPLSTANSIGRSVTIKKQSNDNNTICIKPSASDKINNSTDYIYLYNKDDCITILSSNNGKCETLPDNRNSTGQSKSYMMAKTNTVTNFPSIPVDIDFDTVVASYGNDITVDTNGVFTLKANKTYKLEAEIACNGTGNGQIVYTWVDSNNVELVANTGRGVIEGDTDYTHSIANVIYTPLVDAQVKVRAISGTATVGNLTVASTKAYIECLTTQATVINTVDYIFARVTSNITTANTIIPVSPVVGNIGVVNNMFSLIAGKTYELEAFIEFNGNTGNVWAEYVWTDSSGTYLPTSTTGLSVPVQSASADSSLPTKAIVTPTQNMSVKVMTTGTVAGITGIALTRSYFKITQIGSTAQTLNSGTKAQRIAMSPTVGYEFYQTDNGEGKYIYSGGQWCQISGLSYMSGYKTVSSGVATGTIINFVVRDSFNMGTITPPSIPLKAGKTYEIHAFTQIDGSAPAGARFAFVNAVGEAEIVALNHGVSYTSTFTGHVGPQPVAGGFYTPSADIDLKLKCISISGSPELAYESFRLEVKQIS